MSKKIFLIIGLLAFSSMEASQRSWFYKPMMGASVQRGSVLADYVDPPAAPKGKVNFWDTKPFLGVGLGKRFEKSKYFYDVEAGVYYDSTKDTKTWSSPGGVNFTNTLKKPLHISLKANVGKNLPHDTKGFFSLELLHTEFKYEYVDDAASPPEPTSQKKEKFGLGLGVGLETKFSSKVDLQFSYAVHLYQSYRSKDMVDDPINSYSARIRPLYHYIGIGLKCKLGRK